MEPPSFPLSPHNAIRSYPPDADARRCTRFCTRYVAADTYTCSPSHHAAYDLAEGLEAPVQLLYLGLLLSFLAVGAYLVVRQVLIRRELEEAAKVLGERVRTGEAVAEDYFELGVILLRKKLYTQATRNLEKAKKAWDGEPEELAQVCGMVLLGNGLVGVGDGC